MFPQRNYRKNWQENFKERNLFGVDLILSDYVGKLIEVRYPKLRIHVIIRIVGCVENYKFEYKLIHIFEDDNNFDDKYNGMIIGQDEPSFILKWGKIITEEQCFLEML